MKGGFYVQPCQDHPQASADTAGCNGKGWREDASYTLNTIDRPAVAYGIDQQGGKGGANESTDVTPPILSDSHGTPHAVAYYGICESVTNTQNQRNEVRDLHDVSGSLSAQPGMKQQTYVVTAGFKGGQGDKALILCTAGISTQTIP